MDNPQEIIITTRENPDTPKNVKFEELYILNQMEQIITMMLLWNHNSYYVNAGEKTFIINGGRKMSLAQLGDCKFIYRRRNQFQIGMNTDVDEGPKKKLVNWLIGLDEIGTETMVLLQISEDGDHWMWADKL